MSGNREEILANFQGCTGIENVEEAIMWLENANWDLLNAIKSAIPQETANQGNMLMYDDEKKTKMNGVGVTISSDFVELPSTSDPQGILEIHVHYINHVYKLQVPDTMTVGCIKTIIYSDTSIPPCQQRITGWPSVHFNDDTTLKKLNMPKISHLYLQSTGLIGERNRVTEMDIVEEAAEQWTGTGGAVKKADTEQKEVSRGSRDSSKSPENQELSSSGGRRARSGRLVKRLKRDNSKMLYDLKIYDEANNKEYSLKLPGGKTVGQVKKDAASLTQIPTKEQFWCGWPGNVTDTTKLCDMDLDQPFHCLILQSLGGAAAQNSVPTNACGERVPSSPIFIDLVGDTDSSPEDFEDASESFAGEEELFNEEASSRNRIAPLIPDNVEDETAGSVHFIDSYNLRYGPTAPSFFPGPLEEAIKEACFRPARERRMLAIYLHHDGSVLTNVFCTELLGFETVLQTFANYFVVWGWDITNRGNREMFLNSVTRLLGSTVTDTVTSISTDLLPALMIISRSRANTELLNVIYGNIGINELLTMLIHAVDVFTDLQETEIKDEEERAAREQIKLEQDKAYQQSLQMDRAKEEAKKQQLLLQTQEEERLKEQQKIEEEKRQAERLAVESRLPDEPSKDSSTSEIVKFRFRPPSGDFFERRFLHSNELQVVFDFLLVKGFRLDEYKVISSWPRKDISTQRPTPMLSQKKYQ